MPGRPKNKNFEALGFDLAKQNNKYVGICRICQKILRNTAATRLQSHRNVCRPKLKSNNVISIFMDANDENNSSIKMNPSSLIKGDIEMKQETQNEPILTNGKSSPAVIETCYNCGSADHNWTMCRAQRTKCVCYICGKEGHMARKCPDVKTETQKVEIQPVAASSTSDIHNINRKEENDFLVKPSNYSLDALRCLESDTTENASNTQKQSRQRPPPPPTVKRKRSGTARAIMYAHDKFEKMESVEAKKIKLMEERNKILETSLNDIVTTLKDLVTICKDINFNLTTKN